MAVRIFLAEDHHLVRQGTRMLLESESGFEVIGEAEEGLQALRETLRLRPDVLIVDIVLPNLNGVEITREVKRRAPGIKVIPLSMYDNEAYVIEALKAGAAGYVLKKSTAAELVQAVQQVLAGNLYLSPPLNELLLEDFAYRAAEDHPSDPYDHLTERERQVLQMAVQGLNNPEIAARLLLSVRTVEMHRAHLLKKLHLTNQTELVRYALKRGLIQ
jgi:DNA-binding NarL/FixJ family response regulator